MDAQGTRLPVGGRALRDRGGGVAQSWATGDQAGAANSPPDGGNLAGGRAVGQSAEELRREIEATRGDLGTTIDAIGDRVSPGRIVERRTNRMRGGIRSVRESVMGRASSATGAVTGTASGAAGGVSSG